MTTTVQFDGGEITVTDNEITVSGDGLTDEEQERIESLSGMTVMEGGADVDYAPGVEPLTEPEGHSDATESEVAERVRALLNSTGHNPATTTTQN